MNTTSRMIYAANLERSLLRTALSKLDVSYTITYTHQPKYQPKKKHTHTHTHTLTHRYDGEMAKATKGPKACAGCASAAIGAFHQTLVDFREE